MNPAIIPRYTIGQQLPRSLSVSRWQRARETFILSQTIAGSTPVELARPDTAIKHVRRSLATVRHDGLYTLFLSTGFKLVDAHELVVSDETHGALMLQDPEVATRIREIVKLSMSGFASSVLLVLHNASGVEENRKLAQRVFEQLAVPMQILNIDLADQLWIEKEEARSWFSERTLS
ncbi:JAB domain-containing protein [Burkholderia gladioli]|uniref:JAB domain-containing protein n=1 Tax=Burkholderia gladioli TaxID=28095 RepID=UPI001C5F937A|nr:JAB domain-containing protein [Burkholderia gladioli]MBW5284181.1 hypothetical protein [Burkholderia gladioli]